MRAGDRRVHSSVPMVFKKFEALLVEKLINSKKFEVEMKMRM